MGRNLQPNAGADQPGRLVAAGCRAGAGGRLAGVHDQSGRVRCRCRPDECLPDRQSGLHKPRVRGGRRQAWFRPEQLRRRRVPAQRRQCRRGRGVLRRLDAGVQSGGAGGCGGPFDRAQSGEQRQQHAQRLGGATRAESRDRHGAAGAPERGGHHGGLRGGNQLRGSFGAALQPRGIQSGRRARFRGRLGLPDGERTGPGGV